MGIGSGHGYLAFRDQFYSKSLFNFVSSNNKSAQFKLPKYVNQTKINKLIRVWKCIYNKKNFEKTSVFTFSWG